MKWQFAFVIPLVACSASESDRDQRQAERRQVREALLASDVVQATRTPTSPERLIYDPPTILSRDTTGTGAPR